MNTNSDQVVIQHRPIKKFTPHQIERMGEEHRSGKTLRKIARDWGIPYRTLQLHKKNGFGLKREDSLDDEGFNKRHYLFDRSQTRFYIQMLRLLQDHLSDLIARLDSGLLNRTEWETFYGILTDFDSLFENWTKATEVEVDESRRLKIPPQLITVFTEIKRKYKDAENQPERYAKLRTNLT